MIRAVLWDADGVLQQTPVGWEERVGAVIGADRVGSFAEELWSVSAEALVGRVDFAAHIDLVVQNQTLAPLRDELLATWAAIEPVAHVREVVTRLRTTVPCYLASNQDSYRAQVMRQHLGYDDLLDGCFFSCDLGAAKPAAAFFAAVVESLGHGPEEILFIDDLPDNVTAARAAGLMAEQWHHDLPPEALEEFLTAHGLSPV